MFLKCDHIGTSYSNYSKVKESNLDSKRTVVFKFGGVLAQNDRVIRQMAEQIWQLRREQDCHVIVVHGGGVQINAALIKRGMSIRRNASTSERITDYDTLRVCDKALRSLNKKVTRLFNQAANDMGLEGHRAIGMAGYDHNSVIGKSQSGHIDDYSGQVLFAKTSHIEKKLNEGRLLVINSMSLNEDASWHERRLNMNADNVALAIAVALQADEIVFCSNVAGVLDRDKSLIKNLTLSQAQKLIDMGIINGGMTPKVHAAIRAAEKLKHGSTILDGRKQGAIFQALTNRDSGTRFLRNTL